MMSPARSREGGFTLVEMMIVVIIISVLASLAVSAPDEDDATVDGIAGQLQGDLDQARLRGMGDHRWQRMIVSGQSVWFQEGDTLGMAPPTAWTVHHALTLPSIVRVVSISATSAIDPTGTSAPAGTGLASGVTFAPDGSSGAHTIYLSDDQGRLHVRLVVFGATGTVLARQGW